MMNAPNAPPAPDLLDSARPASPGPFVVDGRRKRPPTVAPADVPGLDFPTVAGGSIRLPYPAPRIRPVFGGIDPLTGETIVSLAERLGYPAPVQRAVDRFLESFDGDGGPRRIFCAAAVAAWTMVNWINSAGVASRGGLDPTSMLAEFGSDDAIVFVHRMVRLVNGLVDLEQDADGAYLVPGESTEPKTDPEGD